MPCASKVEVENYPCGKAQHLSTNSERNNKPKLRESLQCQDQWTQAKIAFMMPRSWFLGLGFWETGLDVWEMRRKRKKAREEEEEHAGGFFLGGDRKSVV